MALSAATFLAVSDAHVFAQVQSPGPGASPRSDPPRDQPADIAWSTLDSDGDGSLSPDEFNVVTGLSFDTVDKDGDRRVTADEYRDARMHRDNRNQPSDIER